MLSGVMAGGEASYFDDLPVTLERSGYTEECYFTFCYAPVHDEAGEVGGIFGTVSETTSRVIGERRLQLLRELSDIARAVDSVAEVCARAAEVFAEHPVDVPYALLYIPASGNAVEMRSIDIWRVEDGVFAEHWDEINALQLFQQMGALPPLGALGAQA